MKKNIISNNGGIALETNGQKMISRGGIEIKYDDKPVNIRMMKIGFVYLVVDCSGSMAGSKLEQAKKGALNFAKSALAKEYVTGLVKFGSIAAHICEPVGNTEILKKHLESMGIEGTTNMTDAIILTTEKLRNRMGLRVMVIVTDGQPDDANSALVTAEQAKRQGIDIITIGTDDADEAFLKKIASRTDLNVMVSSNQLAQGIASTINMLPQHKKGGSP